MSALNSDFFVDGDNDILDMMSQSFSENSQANETFGYQSTLATRAKTGDASVWGEIYSNFSRHRQNKFTFPRIPRIINMIGGHQRRMRKSTVVLPIEGADELTSDQFSTLMKWVNNTENVYHTISDAFEGAITTGLNMLSIWMDYREDPINGDIRVDNMHYNNIMLDQYFSKRDMSDAQFIWTRKFVTKQQAASLIPERKSDIMKISGGFKDQKFRWLPPNLRNEGTNLVAFDEYWYQSFRNQDLLVDTQSGETIEWTGSKENLKLFLKDFPQVNVQKIQKKTVKLVILVNDVLMFHGPNPMGIDRYPFVPVLGYFEPEAPIFEWKIRGVVKNLIDAQYLYDRRRNIELDMLESQIANGLMVMEDSLVDDNDAFLVGPGRVRFIKKDAPQGMDSVRPIDPPQIPPSMIQLSELLAKEITEISGVNEELLGSADDDKAGILSMLRQGAGLTTLENLFDGLDMSQKTLGELTMELIQANWGPGKVGRILGEEPSEQFFNKAFQRFDSVVAEGILTETQRKANFATKLEMVKLGLPVPMKSILEDAPLFGTKSMQEAIEEEQKSAQEAQQKQAQLEETQIMSQVGLANARAVADEGLGLERISRVEENKELAVERRAKAIEDISDSKLNRAKTLRELQDLDLSQLSTLIDIGYRLGVISPPEQELQPKGEQNAI